MVIFEIFLIKFVPALDYVELSGTDGEKDILVC